jgi:hypothetical protein
LAIFSPQGLSRVGAERREWIVKVAVLAVQFGHDWLAPALERLRSSPARNPQGLMATILDDECQRIGTRFNREMARVEIPPEFWGQMLCSNDSNKC